MTTQRLVDLSRVEREVSKLTLGQSSIDLSDVDHGPAAHADMVAWSGLGWWLMGHEPAAPALGDETLDVVLPEPGSAPMRFLGRTGLMTAAANRSAKLGYRDDTLFDWTHLYRDPQQYSPRLPGVAWASYDELDGDQLRVVPDLASSRRRVPELTSCGLHYPWLLRLNLGSPAISGRGIRRFISDADTVISELIDNVHRWSRADKAYAVVSLTEGGARRSDRRVSWNRLHVVVADNGIGIPSALRRDAAAHEAVRAAAGADSASGFSDIELLKTLVFRAFGARRLANHNGFGLNATQVRAAQWVGALDVLTVGTDGGVLRLGTRGLSEESVETDVTAPELPGARGTLVHVMLQAVDQRDAREEAAVDEHLPFDVSGADEVERLVYSSRVAKT